MPEKNKFECDSKLLLLKHLYREEVDPQKMYELLSDSENLEEFEALKGVKSQLENHAPRHEVSAPKEIVDRVLLIAKQKSRRVQRAPKLAWIGSVSTVAVIAFIVLWQTSTKDEQVDLDFSGAPSQVELQWDDTQERIEMQQALNIVRQRTNPDLWDESEVIRLDSFSNQPSSTLPGVQTTSSTSQ